VADYGNPSMLIVLAAVGGIIAIGSQSKFIPYVVRVDSLGDAIATQRADVASPVDARVVQAQVGSFIQSARMVTADVEPKSKPFSGSMGCSRRTIRRWQR
jgi:type IV secretion system protein VirB5